MASLQTFTIPAGYQGLAPVYLSADNVLTFSGQGQVGIVLINVPTPVAVWPASSTAAGTTQQVADAILNGQVETPGSFTNGGLSTMEKVLGPLDTIQHVRAGSAHAGTLATASTVAVITGAPGSFVTGIDIYVQGGSTGAAATTITVAFSTVGTILTRQIPLSVTALAGSQLVSLTGLQLLGPADNVTITSSAAFTAGGIAYTIFGGTTAIA